MNAVAVLWPSSATCFHKSTNDTHVETVEVIVETVVVSVTVAVNNVASVVVLYAVSALGAI